MQACVKHYSSQAYTFEWLFLGKFFFDFFILYFCPPDAVSHILNTSSNAIPPM